MYAPDKASAMSINPRFPFLILLTGSFMGLWSQDEQPSAEMVIAQAFAQQRFEMIASVDEKSDEDASQPELSDHVEAEVHTAGPKLEVPDYIAAGTYRAVNHVGEVSIVEVGETVANENLTARDFYTHETGSERWYLIRLDAAAIATLPDVTTVIR